MLVDLDDERALDPARVGAKAAWLAMGRRAGLPVLPGFVVDAGESGSPMRIGADALATRGPGGAQLVVSALSPMSADAIRERAGSLGPVVVARSSTSLEASSRFSGAFTSYVDLTPIEAPRGVAGCWASAFSASAQDLLAQAGVDPTRVRMAVLIQPALDPDAGGLAIVDGEGSVTVVAVKGPPGRLLQGWEAGATARRVGTWVGDDLIDMIGTSTLNRVAEAVLEARRAIGANRFEWAVQGDQVWLLQAGLSRNDSTHADFESNLSYGEPEMVEMAWTAARAPGPLGGAFVLPWALGRGRPTDEVDPATPDVSAIRRLAAELTSQVWGQPPDRARGIASECLRVLRSDSPQPVLVRMRGLRSPEPSKARELMSLLAGWRSALVEVGAAPDLGSAWFVPVATAERAMQGEMVSPTTRVGPGVWEPFLFSVTRAAGSRLDGISASGGVGAGISWRRAAHLSRGPAPRRVVVASSPVPAIAPVLWDASAMVTTSGGVAAHLFDSARALGVPAVSGVELPARDGLVAVDGHSGVVSWLDWPGDD